MLTPLGDYCIRGVKLISRLEGIWPKIMPTSQKNPYG